MKKMLFVITVISSCFLLSCNNTGSSSSGMSEKAKKNLETAQAVAKMFETKDYSKVGDYIAADAVDHSGPRGEVKGLDNIKAEFNEFGSSMSDMKNETVKEVADDEYVFQWMKESWTQTKDEMGMKAGSKMDMNAIEVSKFNADGKVTDHWSFMSMNDMMKMMPQGMGNMMDSTHKDTSKMKM